MNETSKCVNGLLQVGDMVLSTPDDEYACLVGVVTHILKMGDPEHETENESDEVYVNFENNYSDYRIKELEEMFSELYEEEMLCEDLPLDEIIVKPEYLLRITGIRQDLLSYILDREANAASYCYILLRQTLLEGVDKEAIHADNI